MMEQFKKDLYKGLVTFVIIFTSLSIISLTYDFFNLKYLMGALSIAMFVSITTMFHK